MKSLRLLTIIAATLMLIYPGIMFPQGFAQQDTTNQGTTTGQGTTNPSTSTDQGTTNPGTSTDQGTTNPGTSTSPLDQATINAAEGSCNPGGTATTGYFLQIAGISGESGDQNHKCQIDILSFSWGLSNSATVSVAGTGFGGGGGAGKVTFGDLHITKRLDSSSPILMVDSATGKHISTAILTLRKAGGDHPQDFLKITLTDILISSYQTGGTAGQDVVPVDQFSINFAKIKMEYTPQDSSGNPLSTITGCYNHLAHRAQC